VVTGFAIVVVGLVYIGYTNRNTTATADGQLPPVGQYTTHRYLDQEGNSEPFGNLSFTVPSNHWVHSSMSCEGRCLASLELLRATGSDLRDTGLRLSVDDQQDSLTLDKLIEQDKDRIAADPETTTIEDTTIAGVKAKKYTTLGLVTSIDYFFVKDGYGYTVSHYDTTDDALVKTVLNSLKFTD
jgi:hypothetical protein